MRDKIKGAVLGALVAACATVLLAQTPPWTAPITWTTGDLLTAAQFNAQFRDNLLNLRAFAACADTGISGTASADTVLFGDCEWKDIPATTVVALDMGSTTTTASAFETAGPTASLSVSSGQTVSVYFTGSFSRDGSSGVCELRVHNVTTDTTLVDGIVFIADAGMTETEDNSPSLTVDNLYEIQIRRTNTSGDCRWFTDNADTVPSSRGFIAVVT